MGHAGKFVLSNKGEALCGVQASYTRLLSPCQQSHWKEANPECFEGHACSFLLVCTLNEVKQGEVPFELVEVQKVE